MAVCDIVGIDLGTTFSSVCLFYLDKSEAVMVPNEKGKVTSPSWVCFQGNDVVVGETARNRKVSKPRSVAFDAKRIIGRSADDKTLHPFFDNWPFGLENNNFGKAMLCLEDGRRKLLPEQVSAEVLKYLKHLAEKTAGTTFDKAVITIPANFSNSQREATLAAARLAGFRDPIHLLQEPTAAAIAYSFNKSRSKKNILVFDFGGGTLDVTVLHTGANGDMVVKSTAGDTLLGGRDVDMNLVRHFATQIASDHGIDIFDSSNRLGLMKLEQACEGIKCQLSEPHSCSCHELLEIGEEEIELYLTRNEFEKLNKGLFDRCLSPIKEALRDASLRASDIDEVVMVGGSSRILCIRDMLRQFFNKEPNSAVHPDHAITIGAAIKAATLTDQKTTTQSQFFNMPSIIDITPFSLGMRVANGDMDVIIPKGATIPTTKSKKFRTSVKNQETATIAVYEGDSLSADKNRLIGKFVIKNIPPRRKGAVPFEVTFQRDDNGILQAKASSPIYPNVKGEMSFDAHESADEQIEQVQFEQRNQLFNAIAGLSVIEGSQKDQYLNPAGSQYDLGVDGAFSDFSIVIGNFCPKECELSKPLAALQVKGFRVHVTESESEFVNELQKDCHDIAWFVSGNKPVIDGFADSVLQFHRRGKGVYIWGDNEPWFTHANSVLPQLFGIRLIGNTYGDKVIQLSTTATKGTFLEDHLITTALEFLYEGITICYPDATSPKLHVLATSTDGNPVILYADESESAGRIVVDCGFTKLWCHWDSAGTGRYVSNAACWLTGEVFIRNENKKN